MAGPDASPSPETGAGQGILAGATAMVCVGGSVAVSSVLVDAPLFTAQGVRYALACLLLLTFARASGRRLVRPRGTEWLWLLGVSITGLVIFNVALVEGARHAEPAVLGVAVACVPLVVAVIGPLLEGRRPRPLVLAAALVVTCGAALVQGLGRADAVGLAWAAVVLACEAGFTLLAVPVLGRHGPWGVSVHTTWIAAVVFAVLGITTEGPTALAHLRHQDILAIGYLAVAVTAVAFVLWYSSVRRLGAGRAGLLTGVAPVAAAAAGIALGAPAPRPLVWVGIAVVAAGLALGLPTSRRPRSGRTRSCPDGAPTRWTSTRWIRSRPRGAFVHFQHSDQIWADFPHLAAGVLYAEGITAGASVGPLIAEHTVTARARLADGSEAELPQVQAWRRAFSQMGLKPTQYRCASEALLRRFRKASSLPRVHPLVDLCNALSMAWAIPVAAFDVSKITDHLQVQHATGDEDYLTFTGEVEHPDPGEVVFADGAQRVHARRWTNRQSGLSAVRATTNAVLVVAEGLHDSAAVDVRALIDTLAGELDALWATTAATAVLTRSSPRFTIPARPSAS